MSDLLHFYSMRGYKPGWGFAIKSTLLFLLLFCQAIIVQATHLRAGQITTTQNGLTVTILIEVWTNNESQVLFGGDQDVLDFGDGTYMLVPEQRNQAGKPGSPPLPTGVSYASFTVTHTYAAIGDYTISYREPNRNGGVLNMDASVDTRFYLETKIIIDLIGNNFSPYLAVDPIDKACTGVAFTHNPGAYDPNPQDSISYVMQVPYADRNTEVVNYRDPNDPKFYAGLDYSKANEAQTDEPSFNINPVTGTLTWDAPGAAGEYNIAFHVIEWRKVDGRWRQLGYVRRDMQILVEDCLNKRPDLQIPPDTCIVAGTKLEAEIIGTDDDGDPVKIEAFSPIFEVFTPPATITPNPGPDDFRNPPAVTDFSWQTNCSEVKDQPYAVVFKITDRPPQNQGPSLATFKTWFITVVGPPPLWISDVEGVGYTRNEASRTVTVNWQDYACDNAVTMQVWRKVDGSDFEPSNCETGMPAYLGYELVGTVPIGTTSFTDTNNGKGLTVGAQYCYRLVAVFPANTGSESLVSQDLCVEPFKIVTPVVTNVSVIETRPANGRIEVRWIPPIESETLPPDYAYTYKVFRQSGFAPGTGPITQVGAPTTNLFILDESAELNTTNEVYNYFVAAYVNATDKDSLVSTAASTVRLEARSRLNRIELDWSAVVPWSNSVTGLTHKVYRVQTTGDPVIKDDLQFLTDVDVTTSGFSFIDNSNLEQQKYCYMVETYGSYGTDKIPAPLINQSQIICAEPGDDTPPCKPLGLTVENENCKQGALSAACSPTDYTNVLTWESDASECNDDIDYYDVYYSNSPNGDYQKINKAPVRDTRYEDKGATSRTSYAACYRIAAIDRSQNISELSDPICIENCPYYELPNVFTPNGDGCNDLFSAYSDRDAVGEVPDQCVTTPESKRKCARFVERVVFKVYNRWGKEVYSYVGENTDDENTIWIDWDGRSEDGKALSTGVYYYVADVTFIAIDPSIKYQTRKGTIHLIRDEN